jgi:hypothetical protein
MGLTHLEIEWNPWSGGYHPKISFLYALSPTELVEPLKIPGYPTVEVLGVCVE